MVRSRHELLNKGIDHGNDDNRKKYLNRIKQHTKNGLKSNIDIKMVHQEEEYLTSEQKIHNNSILKWIQKKKKYNNRIKKNGRNNETLAVYDVNTYKRADATATARHIDFCCCFFLFLVDVTLFVFQFSYPCCLCLLFNFLFFFFVFSFWK